ncbi:ComF family protein [Aeromicrobium sp.]|uniref:ComF family protein n=1 Tax=Aeromicrobium sp. TaxID=1871063 RepID=UPI003D6A4174
MDLTTAAVDLLLGAACPGCGRAARTLCVACGPEIAPRPNVVHTRPRRIVASGEHTGVLRLTIVAWKEEGRFVLLRPLAHLLAASVAEVVGGSLSPVALVPVPTSRRHRRARGADVVDELARTAAGLLGATGVDVTVRQALMLVRRTVDQSGLGARDRAGNLDGAFALRSSSGLAGRDIVVVDDIVTTGSTLGEAFRALSAGGHRPIAAAVVAHRPRG